MNATLAVIFGLLLRLGIPLAITILVFTLLRRLDARWQREAAAEQHAPVPARPCWEVKGCSADKMKTCPAVAHPETPCWQVFRSKEGALREGCLDCDVFRLAPAPVKI
jgi:hypothetical protein